MKRFSNKTAASEGSAKRPRVGQTSTAFYDPDPFDEDDFTADDLLELDRIATQSEQQCVIKKEERTPAKKIINNVPMPKSVGSITGNLGKYIVTDLQKQLDHYQKKAAELELANANQLKENSRKEGETKLLREKLNKSEKQAMEHKIQLANLQQMKKKEISEKEESLEKELESIRGQMEFKEAEILESQNVIRTLEQKNKMLMKNHQMSSSPSKSSGSSGTAIKRPSNNKQDKWGLQSSQENAGSAKRIKFIKPKPMSVTRRNSTSNKEDVIPKVSPRISNANKTTSLTNPRDLRYREKFPVPKIFSRSTSIQADLLKVQIVDNEAVPSIPLLTCLQSENTVTDDTRPPSCPMTTHKNSLKSAIQGLQNLSVTSSSKAYGVPSSDIQDYVQLLPIAQSALSHYVSLCRTITTAGKNTSASSRDATDKKVCSATEKVVAGLQMLKTIIEHVPKIVYILSKKELNQQPNTIVDDLKLLCSAQYWCARLPSCYDISTSALSVLTLLLQACDQNITKLFELDEQVIGPLLQCDQVQLKCNLIDVLLLSLHKKDYAESLANGGAKSVVIRICELYCQRQPHVTTENTWLNFLSKSLEMMSFFTSRYKDILKKHQCFADIYHACDVMLHNQLIRRKQSTITKNNKRDQIISDALCLLHSCTMLYADGIPNSRREQKHQKVLVMLKQFHDETASEPLFWNDEMRRVLKSEVKNLYEENIA